MPPTEDPRLLNGGRQLALCSRDTCPTGSPSEPKAFSFACCRNKKGSSLTGKIFYVPLVCPSLDENTSLRARHSVKGPHFLARFTVGSQ